MPKMQCFSNKFLKIAKQQTDKQQTTNKIFIQLI